MDSSKRIIGTALAIVAVACVVSYPHVNAVYSRDPIYQNSVGESVEENAILGLISQRDRDARTLGHTHPTVVSLDKQIEDSRARADLSPHWPHNSDRLRSYRATGNLQPTIDALVDRVLLLEAEVRFLKARESEGE